MVGVPRSRGCQMCIQRHIKEKCDTLRPECSQCLKKELKCPGYVKPPKFMDQRPFLEKRYGKRSTESIDEQVVPALVSKSMSRQQPIVFRDFVLTAFPRFFGLNKNRVHVPWIDYVAGHLGKNSALDGAIYCINSVFMGGIYGDSRLKDSSQEIYGKTLVSFQRLMKNEDSLRSRETLSSSMLLCMFEAYAQTSRDSWTRHAAGASVLMSMRGPTAHLTDFDRCLYLSFRSFIVAHSFIQGTPCLFERPEWQDLINTIRKQDMVDPRVDASLALIIEFSDLLFMEVVKIPGFISQTRRILAASALGKAPNVIRAKHLKSQVINCRECICTLTIRLQLALATEKYPGPEGKVRLVGPIPLNFPRSFAGSLFRGTANCFKIIDLLLDILSSCEDGEDSQIAHMCNKLGKASLATQGEVDVLPFRITSRIFNIEEASDELLFPMPEKMGPTERWLDQVASSLGIGTLDIIILDNNFDPSRARKILKASHTPLTPGPQGQDMDSRVLPLITKM